jgi:alpha-L-fucosidase
MKVVIFLMVIFGFFNIPAQPQLLPVPAPRQLQWQQLETNAFLHFTVNTYTNKEWGDGTESPSIFNPVKFDARQWVKALKEAGFKIAIITAKHHDGFCLWPSKFTEHSVKNSPWKNGKGDVVKEVAEACKEYGIKFGFYLSPWDRHELSYGTDAYNDHYKNQLKELLTGYGEVSEVWFDGAKGANAKAMVYDFKGYWEMVRSLQPNAVMFSDIGPDVRWVGNEAGSAGDTCWSTIDTTGMAPGVADPKYLNRGDPKGHHWIPAETDVSIRPGWFWHEAENNAVRTPQNLVNLYYQSVGRNSLLLLNIPPNKDGLLEETDVKAIKTFRTILNETFKNNMAGGHTSAELTDGSLGTFVSLPVNTSVIIDFKQRVTFDRASFQENIANGQRVEEGLLEYRDGVEWKTIARFATIGYKRLLRFKPITATAIRFTVLKAKSEGQLAELGLFKASGQE